jgi:L-ascorbate metabolism protein UlaG (beta-lactamase superfamily)
LQLTWLGVAGFKLDTSEGATLLIDPYLSRPEQARPISPLQLPDLFPADEILLTNGRFDHVIDTPDLVKQTGAIVHAPEAVCRRLAQAGVSHHSLQPVRLKSPKTLGSLQWQALPSRVNQADSSPVLRALTRTPHLLDQVTALDRQWPVEETVAYLLKIEGLSLVHFGSAAWVEEETRDLRPDVALLPVERPPTVTSATVQLTLLLKPKLVIPHHWDDYYPPLSQMIDLEPFKTAVSEVAPEVNVYIPTPGQSFAPADLL